MDIKGTFSKGKVKGPISITAALTSAVLEWLLMIFLFIDGGFAYLVTKFAQYYQLQDPCLLCSRLDHVLGKERAGFYWELICPNHKLKISSLVLCHIHNNLVDVHGMCESCLVSFATVNKSNAETYRLLVGKMGAETPLADEDPILEGQVKGLSDLRKCYCCKEECVSRGFAQKLFQINSSCSNAAEVDAPVSVTNGPERGDTKEISNEPSISVFDPLPHLEYKKVKVSSDSESEAAHSDCDSARSLIRAKDCSENDSTDRSLHPEPQVFTVTDDFATEKLINPASVPGPSLLDPEIETKGRGFPSITTSGAAVGLGLEEINWQQAEQKTDASATSELITFDEVNPLLNVNENHLDVGRETCETVKQVVEDCGEVSRSRGDVIPNIETESDSKPVTNETSLPTAGSFDLGDAYKLAVGNRGKHLSGKFMEQTSFKDSTRMSEDLKVLLAQLSSARGTDTMLSSPRVSLNGDELRILEASSSIGLQMLQKRISLERNESGLSLEGSSVSELEGESVADRLKRQVEHDRRLMAALYRELEEERNASAVAAHQAMAMITRVQEEKAALQMEALQCLRMMEEQAEYDNEALQKANDLLVQKEKVIQDLEAELELYGKKLGNLALFEDALAASYGSERAQADTICSEGSSTVQHNANDDKPNCSISNGEVVTSFGDHVDKRSPILDFESERQQIVRCLNKLEEQLHLFSKDDAGQDSANINAEFSTEEWVEVGNPKELDHRVSSRYYGEVEEIVHLEPGAVRTSPSGVVGSTCEFPDTLRKGKNDSKSGHSSDGDVESLRKGDEGHRFIEEIAGHLKQLHFIWYRRRSELAHN